ncbi:nicastrin [Hyalella azteca]|uniref:Nicastrin n=1 Tax=Hyalella azteca TaxID=294128 RepID=A0A8B7NCX9_HYAAZ|nr:nicastrin [Hyalella azteca]
MISRPAYILAKMGAFVLMMTLFVTGGFGTRVSDKIYEDIQGNMACFKRFNGTHEVGCTSDYFGNVGVLYIPKDVSDVHWAVTSGPHDSYILAVEPELFTRQVLMIAKNSSNVRGIIVLHSEDANIPKEESPADTCPSHEYGLYNHSSSSKYANYCPSTEAWNAIGNSLLFESFNFPVFLIMENQSITSIKNCYEEFSMIDSNSKQLQDWPLCALQLHSNMFGTTNTEVCLRRKNNNVLQPVNYCDPIHDYNIVASLLPMEGDLQDSSVIVVAARADAASMFDNISPGADAAVTGLITLLAVAEALGRQQGTATMRKNVMFVLFEGETWDYLGSTTMTYDMSNGNFPFTPRDETDQVSQFNFTHIDFFLELSQLGIHKGAEETLLYLYNDPISNEIPSLSALNKKIYDVLKEKSKKFNVTVDKPVDQNSADFPLPPSSFQSFLKHSNMSGAVLSDHAGKFSNNYYQSYLDDYKNVKFFGNVNGTYDSDMLHIHIARIASTVASAVFSLAAEDASSSSDVKADEMLISDLLVCFLRNVNCTLFREHAGRTLQLYPGYFQEQPAKMYTSVYRGEDILTNITLYLMGHFLGTEINEGKNECWSNITSAIQKFYLPLIGENGTCFSSTARLHSADSPAFTIPGYDFGSGQYPSWTESGWSVTKIRLFLKPNPAEEIALIVSGVFLILATGIVSYWAHKRSETLFVRLPEPAFC